MIGDIIIRVTLDSIHNSGVQLLQVVAYKSSASVSEFWRYCSSNSILLKNNISSKKPSKGFHRDENISTEQNKTSLQHKSSVACSSVLWTSERDESGHHLCRRNEEPGGATGGWAANVRKANVHWRTTSGDLWRPWNGGRSNHQGGRSCQDWEIRPSSDEQSGLLEPETSWGFWTWFVIKKFHRRIHPNLVFTWFLQF